MGDPKKRRKAYQKPRKSFQKDRIEKERETKSGYGLKNKKEFYRAESTIRGKRAIARKLLALGLEQRLKREKEVLDSLKRTGILRGNPTLEDVLTLTPEALLERRLQTIVWRKGLANTSKQARQFIVHGHIAINGQKVNKPSYIVPADEENNVTYFGKEMNFEQKKQKVSKVKKEEKTNEMQEAFEEAKPEEEAPETKAKENTKKATDKKKETKEVVE